MAMYTPAASIQRSRRLAWSLLPAAVLLCIAVLVSVVSASSSISTLEPAEYIRLHSAAPSTSSSDSNRTTMAYITPWNSRGTELVDAYAGKIDMVSPVWYTILVAPSTDATNPQSPRKGAPDVTYVLSGGPPNQSDEAWLKLKLKGAEPRVRVVPRFFLDGWQQKDYADLLSNRDNWQRLTDIIVAEINLRGYDGLVFESAATHLLFEPIQTLSSALKSTNAERSLTVVLQPLRTQESMGGGKVDRMQESQNRMIVQSIPQLASVVDFFSIMTYDMSSAGGILSSLEGKDFPDTSPLRGAKKGSLRQPGPNTSPVWIADNVELILEATKAAYGAKEARIAKKKEQEEEGEWEQLELKDPSNPTLYSDFSTEEVLDEDEVDGTGKQDVLGEVRGKLLMGMPMYGYRYPLFWIDRSTGQGVPVQAPMHAHEAEQLVAKSSASTKGVVPFLRGPGEAVTMPGIIDILTQHDGLIVDPHQPHGEGWFDYTQTITQDSQAHGVKQGDQVYWRLYLPLASTTKLRLQSLHDLEANHPDLGLGISLWELGQSSPLLLNPL